MKITVKNYLENRSMLLECDNPKIVDLAQGIDTELFEVYGENATIDDAIDTAIERFNQYLESKSEAPIAKLKAIRRTSVSESRAKSVTARKANRMKVVSVKAKSAKAKMSQRDLDLLEKLKRKETINEAIEEIKDKGKTKATKRTSVSKSRANSVMARKAQRTSSVSAKVKAKAVSAKTESKITLDEAFEILDKIYKKPKAKPKATRRTSVSKSRANSVMARKAKRIVSVSAKMKAKVVSAKPKSKQLSGTLDRGDVVQDKQLGKDVVVESVNGNKFTGREVKVAKPGTQAPLLSKKEESSTRAKSTPSASSKAKEASAKAKAEKSAKDKVARAEKSAKDKASKAQKSAKEKAEKAEKAEIAKFSFSQGQLVSKGRMLFLVVNVEKDAVSLEELDGKVLENQSLKGFKAAPIAKLDERMVKERKEIAMLETKVKNESQALRKLHTVAVKSFHEARAVGKMPNAAQLGKGASVKFDKLKSLIYQKSVLQAVHRKDVSALKVIVKKSNVDAKSYDKDFKEIESLGMVKKAKKKSVAKPKSFHLLKPKTWF